MIDFEKYFAEWLPFKKIQTYEEMKECRKKQINKWKGQQKLKSIDLAKALDLMLVTSNECKLQENWKLNCKDYINEILNDSDSFGFFGREFIEEGRLTLYELSNFLLHNRLFLKESEENGFLGFIEPSFFFIECSMPLESLKPNYNYENELNRWLSTLINKEYLEFLFSKLGYLYPGDEFCCSIAKFLNPAQYKPRKWIWLKSKEHLEFLYSKLQGEFIESCKNEFLNHFFIPEIKNEYEYFPLRPITWKAMRDDIGKLVMLVNELYRLDFIKDRWKPCVEHFCRYDDRYQYYPFNEGSLRNKSFEINQLSKGAREDRYSDITAIIRELENYTPDEKQNS